MDRQSSSEMRMAFDLLPVIWIGSWDSAAWSINLYSRALASVALIVVIEITSGSNVPENVRNVKRFIRGQRPLLPEYPIVSQNRVGAALAAIFFAAKGRSYRKYCRGVLSYAPTYSLKSRG